MTLDEKKEYERTKKEAWRVKQHAKLSGEYQPTLVEQAKAMLEEMIIPDFAAIIKREEFVDKLTNDEKKVLQVFITNLKSRRKKEAIEESKRQD